MLKTFCILISLLILVGLLSVPNAYAKRPIYYGKAVIKVQMVTNAQSYIIYYRQAKDRPYTYSVTLPSTSRLYEIGYLKMWEYYYYKIAAVDASGREYWWSSEVKFTPQERTHTVTNY